MFVASNQSPLFFNDSISIGSFAAIQTGIFVSNFVENSGLANGSVLDRAPWLLIVGAITTDRTILATTKLKNNEEFNDESIF
ncbi:hypothetical protein K1719_010294 [Acacia pycnantha]|nr:hypothetical protein K1719_010294 [Acacia pycnantha]